MCPIMASHRFFLKGISVYLLVSSSVYASSVQWIGQGSNDNMAIPSHWSSGTVPGSSDHVIFDSAYPGVNLNPVDYSEPFSVLSFDFPGVASVFGHHFYNKTLTFTGEGITGVFTNPNIYITNINNSIFVADLLSFTGSSGATSGSANIVSSNIAFINGSSITSNIHSTHPLIVASEGKLTAINTGTSNDSGFGGNTVARVEIQLQFDASFAAENNVSISALNSGNFSGNISSRDIIGIAGNHQLVCSEVFEVGDNFSCDVQNLGNDSALGTGDNQVGIVNNAQIILQDAVTVGNECSITVSNTGYNSSQVTAFTDYVGWLNEQQLFVGGVFQSGNDFHLTVTNTGVDTSSGYGGGQIGVVSTNSVDGQQIWLQQGCILGDSAVVNVVNSGTYTGTNTGTGPHVAVTNAQQLAIGDSGHIGSYAFSVGDAFTLNISNMGIDSAHGSGGDAVATVGTQIAVYAPCLLADHATLTISNSANYSGEGTSNYSNVGSIGGNQFDFKSSFEAGDYFTLNIANLGTNTGAGHSGNFVGDILGSGMQAVFNASLTIGNNAYIHISNSGVAASTTDGSSTTGSLSGYGKQLYVEELFQAGENLQIVIVNSGLDSSTAGMGNYVGFQNNNTADGSASQLHLNAEGVVGNNASIALSNMGTYQGNNSGSNITGVLAGQQFYSVGSFQGGSDFSLTASNIGTNNGLNQNSNSIGTLGRSQVQFGDTISFGNNVSLVISNSGINQDPSGISNTIGFCGGAQLEVDGSFTAGTNLNIDVSNSRVNAGDSSNVIGYIAGSQILFGQSCILSDGSTITASNSGTVDGSQIVFNNGFTLTEGTATFQAVNSGTIGGSGILFTGESLGGDVNVILENSSLYVNTTGDTFTVGALNGDSTSLAQSSPPLVIDTDEFVNASFSGVIDDFPSITSSLIKTGLGSQKLSGVNTYTGLTTIEKGVLIVNGSLATDAVIDPDGILKGNGTINGILTSTGTIAPGESIGTLTVNTYINNNGTYDVEVNGSGQSDLIQVVGAATLNGGTVLVSAVDDNFVFNQPYTILTADGSITGTYGETTSLAFISSTLAYGADSVSLSVAPDLLRAADACNQYGVATNLDAIALPNSGQNLLISAIATSSLEKAQDSLESLSGYQYTNDIWAAEISTRRFLRRLYDPLRPLVIASNKGSICDAACNDWGTWLETGYGFTEMNGHNAHKTLINSYQVTGGIQKSFCSDLTVGLAGSYEYGHSNYRNAKGNRNSEFASLYGLYKPSMLYGFFDLVYGHASNNVSRLISARNLHYKAHGTPELNTFAFYSELGPDVDTKYLLIQPFVGIEYEKNWRKKINETQSNGWGLSINSKDWSSTTSRLGMHLSSSNLGNVVDLSLDVAWNQLLSSRQNTTKGHFNQFGNTFQICGNNLDSYSIDYALTVLTCFSKGLKGYFELGGESWQHANTFEVLAGIEFSW